MDVHLIKKENSSRNVKLSLLLELILTFDLRRRHIPLWRTRRWKIYTKDLAEQKTFFLF